MARLLNRMVAISLVLMMSGAFAQNSIDYKDRKQFEKFQKRRNLIAQWQINQLKEGALVVKLKTNKTLIDELEKNGNKEMAEEKRKETYFINRNIMAAFMDEYEFSKLYFIYSSAVDSLLNGARQGIFLDSNMMVDPTIVMKENFYMIAERDFVYNSSIGFVPEDSARIVTERGNPSGEVAEAVVKNKYGHQLKKPFPYVCGYGTKSSMFDMAFVKTVPSYYLVENGRINYTIDKTQLADIKASKEREFKKAPTGYQTYNLEKQYAYEVIAAKVHKFNLDLLEYYKGNPKPDIDKIDPSVKPFLY